MEKFYGQMNYKEREAYWQKSLRIAINRERESREEKGSAESRERALSFHQSFESKKSIAHGAGDSVVPSWRGHTASSWSRLKGPFKSPFLG